MRTRTRAQVLCDLGRRRWGGAMAWEKRWGDLQFQFGEEAGFAAEGAAGGAFEFLHEGFELGVGGVAFGGVFDGVAEGGVLVAAGAGEVVEVPEEGGEPGGGVAAFGEFGGEGVLAGGGVGGRGGGDEAGGVVRDFAFEAEGDAVGVGGEGGAGDVAEGGVVLAGGPDGGAEGGAGELLVAHAGGAALEGIGGGFGEGVAGGEFRGIVAVGFEDGADFGIIGGDLEELFGVGDVGFDDLVLRGARVFRGRLVGSGGRGGGGVWHLNGGLDVQENDGSERSWQGENAKFPVAIQIRVYAHRGGTGFLTTDDTDFHG